MARQGFDALCVDMQHGTTEMNDVWPMLQAISQTDTVPVVRVAVERAGDHHEGARPRRLRHHRAAGQHRRGRREGGGRVPLSAGGHALVRAGARRALRRRRLRGQCQRRDRRHGDDRDEGGPRQPRRHLRHARPRRRLHRAGRPVVRAGAGPARRQPGPAASSPPATRSGDAAHKARHQGGHALCERGVRRRRREARLRHGHAHLGPGLDDRGRPPAARRSGRPRPRRLTVDEGGPGAPDLLEVDVDAAAHNVRAVRQLVGPERKIFAVIKAGGYGFGAAEMGAVFARQRSRLARRWPISPEGIRLRQRGISTPVLVYPNSLPSAAARRAGPPSRADSRRSRVGAAYSEAASGPCDFFVKVDVGLERSGRAAPSRR